MSDSSLLRDVFAREVLQFLGNRGFATEEGSSNQVLVDAIGAGIKAAFSEHLSAGSEDD